MLNRLSNEVIHYIAAGEVIESPYSVVKELIENAIDAKATTINIKLKNGGNDLIQITDNGIGIPKSDFPLLAERYTTSKINTISDLYNIHTLGFRGEAISSIASVSKLQVLSCYKDSVDRIAFRAIYNGQRLQDCYEDAHGQGTTFIVEDLFYNTPARKKFVKHARVEVRNIVDLVIKMNIVHPDIRFSLISDNKSLFSSYGGLSSELLMLSVLKKTQFKDELIPISISDENISINGFISTPNLVIKRRKDQIIVINDRIVDNPEIKNIIEQAYRKYIPKGLYPIYLLKIKVAPNDLDVNCHPRKNIVKYCNETYLENILTETIKNLYHSSLTTPQHNVEQNIFTDTERSYSIIGQIKNTYIILEDVDTVYFIDQHALHERILYENFKDQLRRRENICVALDTHIELELTEFLFNMYQEKTEILKQYGFCITVSGINKISVREVPYLIAENQEDEIKDIILNVLYDDKTDWLDSLIIDLSCKSAIKANTVLTQEKIREFVDFMIENQITNCPHGRPLYFTMTLSELGRKFRRII